MTIAIAGNPNCGKTVLFNLLTGSKQKVGNWSGVTIDRKEGICKIDDHQLNIIDLPGIYSLHTTKHNSHTLDEKISCDYLLSDEVDLVINVIDASNLERHLYLTAQLLELNIPTIIALNMTDIAKRQGINIDHKQLAKDLNCEVIPLVANRKYGINALRKSLLTKHSPSTFPKYALPKSIQTSRAKLENKIDDRHKTWMALRLLEHDALAQSIASEKINLYTLEQEKHIEATEGEPADLIIADARYNWVYNTVANCSSKFNTFKKTATQAIDSIVLNRFLGIPIFLLMMYLTFFFAINIGGAFQDFFDIGSTAIFIDGLSQLLNYLHTPDWITAIAANGLGKGINTVITFAPIIGSMFLFLSLLEDSGYMARAAFVVDRLMRAIGLPGKAFVPLIVGFGCNVPTVMATRTLGNKRDRILTALMAPFMSCGARLAIYAVFVSVFFHRGGQNIIFFLYLTGILVAVGTGLLLKYTVLKGNNTAMPTEFPTYHIPHPASILRSTWHRLTMFLKKAGRFIIPICILIGALNSISPSGKLLHHEANQDSMLSAIGKTITPVFSPIGIHKENWPATVGLFTGLLAKEVVVGTLNTLYAQAGDLDHSHTQVNVVSKLKQAALSIPENLASLPSALRNPILSSAPIQDLDEHVAGVMRAYFGGSIGVIAYLLFILLYFPCVSTMAVMRREIGNNWANFSMLWTTGMAYGIATLFYQTATFHQHPHTSTLWITSIITAFAITVITLRNKTRHINKENING